MELKIEFRKFTPPLLQVVSSLICDIHQGSYRFFP